MTKHEFKKKMVTKKSKQKQTNEQIDWRLGNRLIRYTISIIKCLFCFETKIKPTNDDETNTKQNQKFIIKKTLTAHKQRKEAKKLKQRTISNVTNTMHSVALIRIYAI